MLLVSLKGKGNGREEIGKGGERKRGKWKRREKRKNGQLKPY